MLLGRPWQYDRHVHHDGLINKFTFQREERTYSLKLLTTQEVTRDQMTMREKKRRKKSQTTFSKVRKIKSYLWHHVKLSKR